MCLACCYLPITLLTAEVAPLIKSNTSKPPKAKPTTNSPNGNRSSNKGLDHVPIAVISVAGLGKVARVNKIILFIPIFHAVGVSQSLLLGLRRRKAFSPADTPTTR